VIDMGSGITKSARYIREICSLCRGMVAFIFYLQLNLFVIFYVLCVFQFGFYIS
jgi:hypothetical protein